MPDLHGNKQRRTRTEVICMELNTLNSLITRAKNVRHHLIRGVEIEESTQSKAKIQKIEKQEPGTRISSNVRNIRSIVG